MVCSLSLLQSIPQPANLKKSPDIISRGFVYLRESQDLLQQTRYIIKKTIEDTVAWHASNQLRLRKASSDRQRFKISLPANCQASNCDPCASWELLNVFIVLGYIKSTICYSP
jgi:hypothetical protein